ncbi:MAG: cytidine deaminase [Armatimonadota bacterium]|nr:cytidine deaminase [Armatimonadota bacterium]
MSEQSTRPEKPLYYCQIALAVAARGTCLRRNFGAVITNEDMAEIVSTGYVGAPRKMQNCIDRGSCLRDELGVPQGAQYELCRSVHAEMNAIIHAARRQMVRGHLFLACRDAKTGGLVQNAEPCKLCKRVIINAGITDVFVLVAPDKYRRFDVAQDWVAHEGEIFEIRSGNGY